LKISAEVAQVKLTEHPADDDAALHDRIGREERRSDGAVSRTAERRY
jgi:hypothetical protein